MNIFHSNIFKEMLKYKNYHLSHQVFLDIVFVVSAETF